MATIGEEFTQLADACRKRFHVEDRMTIADMVKLITPVVIPTNHNLIPDLYTNADTADTNWARFQVPGFELWDGIQAAKLKNGSVFGYKTAFPAGTYTYSFFAKLKQTEDNATATISFNGINPKTLAAGTLTTDWQRFSYTTTIASDTTGRFQVSPAGMSSTGTLLVAGQKVEKGSTMTDYVKRDGTTIDAPLGGN